MEGSPFQQDLLREAADGLKQIAHAVEGKSIGTMAGELSEFGRQNPVAYLGGAALVGFALARFARASTPAGTDVPPRAASTQGLGSIRSTTDRHDLVGRFHRRVRSWLIRRTGPRPA